MVTIPVNMTVLDLSSPFLDGGFEVGPLRPVGTITHNQWDSRCSSMAMLSEAIVASLRTGFRVILFSLVLFRFSEFA